MHDVLIRCNSTNTPLSLNFRIIYSAVQNILRNRQQADPSSHPHTGLSALKTKVPTTFRYVCLISKLCYLQYHCDLKDSGYSLTVLITPTCCMMSTSAVEGATSSNSRSSCCRLSVTAMTLLTVGQAA